MYTRRKIALPVIVRFAWRNVIFFVLWSVTMTLLHTYLNKSGLHFGIPFAPLSTIGIAVAFYMGFKNSQSYDRLWEARKIWGAIVNLSRSWASMVISTVNLDTNKNATIHQQLVYRHLAWINALRLQLRKTTMMDRENLSFTPDFNLNDDIGCESVLHPFLSDAEYHQTLSKTNTATHLLFAQEMELNALKDQGAINDFEHIKFLELIENAYTYQGQCERIKNFPFPRQYAYFSTVFVWIFVLLLPLGLLTEFSRLGYQQAIWLTVPFSTLISWIFVTIEIVGDNSEDPFENYINDTPMTALCRTIEIDLREMLGETDIPPKIQPVNDILM